ncbi:hypothetical protein [Stenotrophobium rhamnosiphilum]|uniref:Uncharacterized protein n=1 Tax=Stenotrophobium rhamnosiphilum TaxID=2029166 RepID=A0A2T5MIL5_9GAMM|nr:hypothetical protein [Stenotrophobium rhamnosiphilum]PTU32410.1 hypothetical protein CJD38_07105 [Stenotrophobium rhamnosiphilum]
MRVAGYIGLGAIYVFLSAAMLKLLFWTPRSPVPVSPVVAQAQSAVSPVQTIEQPTESDDEFRAKRCSEMLAIGKNISKSMENGFSITDAYQGYKAGEDLLPYKFPHLNGEDVKAVIVTMYWYDASDPGTDRGLKEIENRCFKGELSREGIKKLLKQKDESDNVTPQAEGAR